MKAISRQNVLSLIEATADNEQAVAIQYVKSNGQLVERLVQKSRSKARTDQRPGSTSNYMIRDKGLIRVVDIVEQQHKTLLIHAIVGCNPYGRLDQFYPVEHIT